MKPGAMLSVAVVSLMALGFAIRLVLIGDDALLYDEAWTVIFIEQPLSRIVSWTPIDSGNPPLYYVLLHVWMMVGDSETMLRLPAAISGALAIPVVLSVGRRVAGPVAGLFAGSLVAASAYLVRMAQEARTYSFLLLCAAISLWSVLALVGVPEVSVRIRRLAWTGYVIAAGVAFLAHNTGFMIAVAANVSVIGLAWVREHPVSMRAWGLAQLGVAAIWATWAPGFWRQWTDIYRGFWIPEPTPGWIASQGKELLALQLPNAAGLILVVLLGMLAVFGVWSLRSRRAVVIPLVTFALTAPVVEFVVSLFRPLLIARTLIWATLPLYIAASAGLVVLMRKRVAAGVIVGIAVMALTVWGLTGYLVNFDRPAADEVAAYVGDRIEEGDAILFLTRGLQLPFTVYFGAQRLDAVPHNRAPIQSADLEGVAEAHRVWFVTSKISSVNDSVLDELDGSIVTTRDFPGIRLLLIQR
jgi:hypothetical protein